MPAEPVGGRIRIFQTHDASGAPAVAEFEREVRYEGLISLTETTMAFLRPLSPRETEHPGVFWYTDPANGSGWLRLEEFRRSNQTEIQDAVRVLALSAAIGEEEQSRVEVLSFGNAVANRTTNPYFMILVGAALIVLLVGVAVAMSIIDPTDSAIIALYVLAAAGVFVGAVLIRKGAKRLSWWRRARAEAKRSGMPLPEQLKIWN